MSTSTKAAAAWVYDGVWKVLSDWFRVPKQAPTLPVAEGGFIHHFHPSPQYLRYLKLYFWLIFIVVDLLIFIAWFLVYLNEPFLAWVLALPALFLAIVPDVIAYVAIHLRYDTMWYVMTDQSLRTRRGIWNILEHTITFENVQNVAVQRGPIMYLFGISTIVVETAGASEGEGENQHAVGNKAYMEGIANPETIRRLILDRVRVSPSAGLGDESTNVPRDGAFTPEMRRLLSDVRDEICADSELRG